MRSATSVKRLAALAVFLIAAGIAHGKEAAYIMMTARSASVRAPRTHLCS